MRFIHTADLHLDSPLRGLENYPGAPVERLRSASRQALQQLVQLCLQESIDFLVIAGDVFDSAIKDFNTALHVAEEMRRLEAARIPVYLILGNHDSHQEMTLRTPWPANVHVFDHLRAGTLRLDACQVAIHGRSFPKREVLENLLPEYPDPVPGWFNIGLLHTSASGNPQHDTYAPCSIAELVAKRYQYWALGHVHEHQILHTDPHIVYSGNPQGRHVREVGAKGVVMVEVAGGEVRSCQLRAIDVARWFRETIVLDDRDGLDELHDRVRERLRQVQTSAEGRFAAVRLELEGRCRAHRQLVRDASQQQVIADLRALASEFGDELWLEKIKFRTRAPLDLDTLRQGPDLIGELLRSIDALAADPEQLARLTAEIQPLIHKVGGDLHGEAGETIDFQDPQQLQEWLRDAERILLDRLVESAE